MKLSSILASSALFVLASSVPVPDRETIASVVAISPTHNNDPDTIPTFGHRQAISPDKVFGDDITGKAIRPEDGELPKLPNGAPTIGRRQTVAPTVNASPNAAPNCAPTVGRRQTVAPTVNASPNAAPNGAPTVGRRQTVAPTVNASPNAAPNTAPTVPRRQTGPTVQFAPSVIIAPTVNNAPNTAPTTSLP